MGIENDVIAVELITTLEVHVGSELNIRLERAYLTREPISLAILGYNFESSFIVRRCEYVKEKGLKYCLVELHAIVQ